MRLSASGERNITQCEYDRTRAYWLRISRTVNGKVSLVVSISFPYNKYGGKSKALAEAVRVRDSYRSKYPAARMNFSPSTRSNTGIVGVWLGVGTSRGRSYPCYLVSWVDAITGKYMIKRFYLSHFNSSFDCFNEAVTWRRQKERELMGNSSCDTVNLGDIRRGSTIDKNPPTHEFIFVECPGCRYRRWVSARYPLDRRQRDPSKFPCRTCSPVLYKLGLYTRLDGWKESAVS